MIALLSHMFKFTRNEGEKVKRLCMRKSIHKTNSRPKTSWTDQLHKFWKDPNSCLYKTTALWSGKCTRGRGYHEQFNMTTWSAETIEPVRKLIARFCLRDTLKFVLVIRPVNLSDRKGCIPLIGFLRWNVLLRDMIGHTGNYIKKARRNM